MDRSIHDIIKGENFCIVPWTHLYYFTDGYVYPCPSVAGDKSLRIGKVTDDPQVLWNSEVLKNLRKKMINNEYIHKCHLECNGCLNSCKKYFGLDLLEQSKQIIENTKEDGSCDYNFIAWNVMESNLCNLKCKYCCYSYSNLHSEDKSVVRVLPDEDFINLYEKNYDSVKEIWFASGEPVIQKSTYHFLKKLIKDKRFDVRIRFITNLTLTEYKGEKVYDLLAQFSDVIVFGSWDLDGERGEFIRTNSNSETIKNTIRLINSKGIKFYLQSVISLFNIYYYPDFHKRMYDEGLLKKDNVRYYNLHYPHKYRYSILNTSVKDEIKSKLLDYKEWIAKDMPTLDEFPNRESPLITVDKIIDTLYTGKWGHWEFDEKANKENYLKLLVENIQNKKFMLLFNELIKH